ncbi:hypothetical protein DFJ58DRAFT_744347 [Suillus subalutaceus]|uniref:uncharacterized protein n=1 Tax=Suillus subalutaceus TaxID=48586 RepID=UPI001B8719D4|nr:uncharacterized protein DFJ58DRAFT_744347 [Suillus subalutaceus]KAG1861212.1 hypothetical protein DFJ58DRAFT_744347 [Suillus subalutaceus]
MTHFVQGSLVNQALITIIPSYQRLSSRTAIDNMDIRVQHNLNPLTWTSSTGPISLPLSRPIIRVLFHRANLTSSLQVQSIRIELISGKNLKVPSECIPVRIYVFIKFTETRHWGSAIRVLSSDQSVALGDPRTDLLFASYHVQILSLTLPDVKTLKDDFDKEIRHASFMNPKESRTNLIVLLRRILDEVMPSPSSSIMI